MTEIIRAFEEIDPGYSALFCDLWGCLHDGVTAFPEAVAALERFRGQGGSVVLLTNSPRPAGDVERQLDLLGAPRSCWDPIVSSGDAAQAAMAAGQFGRRVYHVGPERDLVFFRDAEGRPFDIERVPLEDAEGIVCTGLFDDRSETPEDYPGAHPLRQDQGAEAPLRQSRHRGRRGRPAHLLRRGDRRRGRRGRPAQRLFRQAAPADLRAGAAKAGEGYSATRCRRGRDPLPWRRDRHRHRRGHGRGARFRSSSPAAWRQRRRERARPQAPTRRCSRPSSPRRACRRSSRWPTCARACRP